MLILSLIHYFNFSLFFLHSCFFFFFLLKIVPLMFLLFFMAFSQFSGARPQLMQIVLKLFLKLQPSCCFLEWLHWICIKGENIFIYFSLQFSFLLLFSFSFFGSLLRLLCVIQCKYTEHRKWERKDLLSYILFELFFGGTIMIFCLESECSICAWSLPCLSWNLE